MAIRSRENLFGAWAFLIGVVLAVIVGILSFGVINPIILGILMALGLVVGFINVSDKDVSTFLMAAVSLAIVSFAGLQGATAGIRDAELFTIDIGRIVVSTLGALLFLIIPATIVVAIKSLFSISSQR